MFHLSSLRFFVSPVDDYLLENALENFEKLCSKMIREITGIIAPRAIWLTFNSGTASLGLNSWLPPRLSA